MRKTKLLIGTISSILCFSLASCGTESKHVGTEGYEASRKSFNECLEKTFNHQNMTVSYVEPSTENRWTERILGNVSHLVEEQKVFVSGQGMLYMTAFQTWCFENEKGEKIVATEETRLSDGHGIIFHSYLRGEDEYKKNYKRYLRHFDVVDNMEEWLKPFTSTSEGKDLYAKTSVTWDRYNFSETDPDDTDMFFYDVRDSKHGSANEDIVVWISGHIDPKTELVSKANVTVDLPDGCGPDNGACVCHSFGMSYDNVEKINIPDISGWTDKTNP